MATEEGAEAGVGGSIAIQTSLEATVVAYRARGTCVKGRIGV
jgi:hypothetical protein